MTPESILQSVREVYQNRQRYIEAMEKASRQSGSERVLEVIEQAIANYKTGMGGY